MATFKAEKLKLPPITASQAGQIVHDYGEVEVPNTLAANDLILLCNLPADHEPVDFALLADDLDTDATPAITLTVGILNANGDDLLADTNFLTTSNVAQAGGVARADQMAGLALASSNADRVVAAKVITAADVAAVGTVRGHMQYCRKS